MELDWLHKIREVKYVYGKLKNVEFRWEIYLSWAFKSAKYYVSTSHNSQVHLHLSDLWTSLANFWHANFYVMKTAGSA